MSDSCFRSVFAVLRELKPKQNNILHKPSFITDELFVQWPDKGHVLICAHHSLQSHQQSLIKANQFVNASLTNVNTNINIWCSNSNHITHTHHNTMSVYVWVQYTCVPALAPVNPHSALPSKSSQDHESIYQSCIRNLLTNAKSSIWQYYQEVY